MSSAEAADTAVAPVRSVTDYSGPVPATRLRWRALQLDAVAAVHEGEDFRARRRVLFENAAQRAGDHRAAVFLRAADGHAGMDRFDDARCAHRVELFHQRVGDLSCQPLLHLRSAGVAFDESGELAQADD